MTQTAERTDIPADAEPGFTMYEVRKAIRDRQISAVEMLMGLPIPRSLRLELRAFHDSLTPAIIEHERTVA